jgi:putative aminopeptidase FrvX
MRVDIIDQLQELVLAYGPPGQEDEIRDLVSHRVEGLGMQTSVDGKGNLIIGDLSQPCRVLVTAHLDELAMIVRRIEPDGRLAVTSLGGLYPWKLGEGPVVILGKEPVPGVLGFGGIHTEDRSAVAVQAREKAVDWTMATVFTGCSASELAAKGVLPGCRIVVPKERRRLWSFQEYVAGYFLDDRADVAAMLLALEALGRVPEGFVFAATAAEEVGGEGALNLMHRLYPEVCIALELAPNVPDACVRLDASPVLWVNDGYAASQPRDNALVAETALEVGIDLQYQALSRGGSDASCAASHGLCARPITLGLPLENSHGFEVIHRESVDELARLTVALIHRL